MTIGLCPAGTIVWSFRPSRNRDRDGGCDFLNYPIVFPVGNNGEAIGLRVTPGRAKAFRIELPRAGAFVAALPQGLTSHLAVWRKGHLEFGPGGRSGRKGLACEKGRFNVVRGHGLSR